MRTWAQVIKWDRVNWYRITFHSVPRSVFWPSCTCLGGLDVVDPVVGISQCGHRFHVGGLQQKPISPSATTSHYGVLYFLQLDGRTKLQKGIHIVSLELLRGFYVLEDAPPLVQLLLGGQSTRTNPDRRVVQMEGWIDDIALEDKQAKPMSGNANIHWEKGPTSGVTRIIRNWVSGEWVSHTASWTRTNIEICSTFRTRCSHPFIRGSIDVVR